MGIKGPHPQSGTYRIADRPQTVKRACALCGPCPKCRRHVENEGITHKEGCPDSAYIRACRNPGVHRVHDEKFGTLWICAYHFKRGPTRKESRS